MGLLRAVLKGTDRAVSLEGSQLRFLGLLELVAFLSVSRDVLPLPLRLPAALQHLGRAELNSCAALGMRFWSPPFKPSATGEEEEENMGSSPESPNAPEMSGPACCIRVTSEDGALFIINPLFLSEHSSEGWLPAGVPPPFHLPERGGTIRLKNGQGPGLLDKPPAPADAEMGQLGALEPGKEGEPGKEVYGADDFLPVLTYVLVKCDIVSVQLDVEYMMELLDPSQLQGEGGYYLTTWFGALYHISNFQSAMVTRQISLEAQDSIHQWQRRRTIHHNQHSRCRSQDILYVSFQEPFANQKAIPVPAHMTAASVCVVCGKKYGVPNPEAYGLFLVTDSTSRLLAEDSHPQQIRSASLKSHSASSCFVYKLKREEQEAPSEGDGPAPAQEPI
ncbi:Ras and Rab interactor 3 [Chelonia mydas]|uniref:Ras and Rab interactor 3 n=1 Tax=Chelonia mydas TaxID=8469 RepID=M7AT50_CHEMY|nr:Ras and Rab interactor 3 [Chelonia mydas]